MNSITKHWGEIENNQSDQHCVQDISNDIEKSMNKFCLAEFDNDINDQQKLDQLILNPMDPLMLYSISLHKYANDMTEKIRVAELAIESNVLPPIDAVVPIPELTTPARKHLRNSLNYIEKDFTRYSLGEDVKIPELSDAVSKQILVKCVAVMFAHIGFETTHQSVLDYMADILEAILTKICKKLRVAHEDDLSGQSAGFPNIVERVFTEIGLGGIKGLHDYYENRVVKYVNVLYKRCEDLNRHYEKLLEPKTSPQSDKINKVIRINIKREDDIEENPEMHFENGDLGASTLETGFELLNSLEAGTNLVEEEDINVVASASSGVSLVDLDVATASPLNKKKRIK